METLQTICRPLLTKEAWQNELYKKLKEYLPDFASRQIAYQLQSRGMGPIPEIYKVPGSACRIIIEYPSESYAAEAGNIDFFGASKLELIDR